jgi:hypothetical protein|tara:strand:+ start:227 stop:481 length:255 start_codon:yes stop_codon:yes gene_type:complete
MPELEAALQAATQAVASFRDVLSLSLENSMAQRNLTLDERIVYLDRVIVEPPQGDGLDEVRREVAIAKIRAAIKAMAETRKISV